MEKLGLRDALDTATMTADAVAKAVDTRLLQSVEAVRNGEQQRVADAIELERQKQAVRDSEMRAELQKLREAAHSNTQQLADARAELRATEVRAKQAEDALSKRRSQPAAVGRTAERDFASMIGEHADLRISEKLSKAGDYEVWVRVSDASGRLIEVEEPVLVDVKRDTAALHVSALTKLVRDCKERKRRLGVLVADRLEEVTETFGTPRIRLCQGVIVLFTSIDAVVSDLRLVGMFLEQQAAKASAGQGPCIEDLAAHLVQMAQIVEELEQVVEGVAVALEKQTDALRTKVIKKLGGRVRAIAANARTPLALMEPNDRRA